MVLHPTDFPETFGASEPRNSCDTKLIPGLIDLLSKLTFAEQPYFLF